MSFLLAKRLYIYIYKKKLENVTELVELEERISVSIVFIRKSLFNVQKGNRSNCLHHFIMKISNKRKHCNIGYKHS